ncbi:cytochrome P450 CYP82D47-like [Cornus florida]|uniref:cytochrome P450 CYP82D47-like n=1 Tax=Cornus florida TaxID=4283 RepID=UPI00289F1083|nr:cytochrome P450 CYP82D47-like [Cornus florida]
MQRRTATTVLPNSPTAKASMDFSLQQINTSIAGLFSLLVVCYYLYRIIKSRVTRGSRAPEAGGAWPIIGHLHLLATGPQLPHITLGAMADKYGPIFTVKIGLRRDLVVSNWEAAGECFTTNDIAISSRPKFLAAEHLGYNYAMLAFSPYGAYWRELRKIVSVELLSNRRLEMLKNVRVSETKISMKELYELWAEKKNSSGRVSVDMKQWFGDLTLNVVVRMVAGKRYFGANAGSEEARRCQKLLREFFRFLGLFVVADAIPFLGWLDLGGHEKAMKETAKEIDKMVGEWLEGHRRKRDSGEFRVEQDFMDVMLSVLEGADLAGYDADAINKATCLNLISGGADTSTVMMTWVVSLLMNNLHVLKKAQEELDVHVGKQRQVDESDICKLVYLQAIVKETLRLYPAAPLGGPREFTEDCTVGGYQIPKGTRLMLNLWKLQRDPRLWSNPSEFQPERFLTTHKNVDVKGQHFELIPFGAGRRICPGTTLGLQLLHLILATLLHGFDLSTPNNAPVDMTESVGLTNMKATPLEVFVAPRLSPHLY